MKKMYKIRDKRNGLFFNPQSDWTRSGKIWQGLGPLKNHMNLNRDCYLEMGTNFEVVECEIVITKHLSLHDIKPNWIIENVIES